MSTLPEQFSAARQSQVDAQIALFQTYATTAVEKAEKIIALNLSTSRASLEKSSAAVRQLLTAHDPRDLFALTAQSQASFESLLAYGRELFSIAAGAQPPKPAAPAIVPVLAQAQPAKRAMPVIAPSVPEPVPEQPPAPKAMPLAVPEAKAEAPVPAAAPAATPPAKAKPIAKAVDKAVPKEAAKPAAAPFPVAATGLKTAPAPAKSAEPKQLDMLVPKPKAKKDPK